MLEHKTGQKMFNKVFKKFEILVIFIILVNFSK